MNLTPITVAAIIVAILAIAVAIWALLEVRKMRRLRFKFGPEYDRTVQREGDAEHAARVLEKRERRVSSYHIRPLSPREVDGFASAWRVVQEHFVDSPREALSEADQLIDDAMKARGYPVSDFEAQAADLSVDYPSVVENYRAAHAIDLRQSEARTDTEEMRKAMRHYHALFEQLIGADRLHQVREAN